MILKICTIDESITTTRGGCCGLSTYPNGCNKPRFNNRENTAPTSKEEYNQPDEQDQAILVVEGKK